MPTPQQHTPCIQCGHQLEGDALFCPNCGTARSSDQSGDPLMGTVIGDRFLILERLGHGGSGTIYRAEHVTLRRKVAVKVLHHELSRDDLAVERFRREATTVSEIDNDHIVEIHDFGRTGDGRLYLAMELLEGETLQDVIRRDKRLGVERTVDVLLQLGEALAEAHGMGYVHRDLRPRNIWLSNRRGREDFVKLLDFGLAKLVEHEGLAASTSLGMTFGDPKYMSPEQARGEALDRRADIYSMGCIAYEMLTGRPPFSDGKVFDILTRHIDTEPSTLREHREDVPPWLDGVIMRMLAKRPEERYLTVLGLIEALRQRTPTPAPVRASSSPGPADPHGAGEDDGPRKSRARTSTALYGQPADEPEDAADEDAPRADSGVMSPIGLVAGEAEPDARPAQGAARPGASGAEPAPAPGGHRARRAAPEPGAGADGGAEGASNRGVRTRRRGITEPGAATPVPRKDAAAAASPPSEAEAESAPTERQPAPGASLEGAGQAEAGDTLAARNPDAIRPSPEGAGQAEAGGARAAVSESEAGEARAWSASDEVHAADSSGSLSASASGSLSGSGLSGDWFADAEGELDEHGKARLADARAFLDTDDTALVSGGELYYDPRGRRLKIVGMAGSAVVLGLLVILLWPSDTPQPAGEPKANAGAATESQDAPAQSNAAAVLAAMNADAAPAASGSADAGAATVASAQPADEPESAASDPEPAASDPEPAASDPEPAASPSPRRPRGERAGRTRTRPTARTARAAGTRDRPRRPAAASPAPDRAADPAPSDEGAKQAVFFAKMGQQSLQNGNIFEAARHFKKAIELDPKNADALMGQGEIAYRQGSYANAIAHYRKAVRMRPRNARAHILLGEAYLGAGDNNKAAGSFKRALGLRPGDARAQRGYTEATGKPPPS